MREEGTSFIVLQKYIRITLRVQLLYKGIRWIIGANMDNKIIIKII